MAHDSDLGLAALSLTEASDSAGFLYQTQDGAANVSVGYIKDGALVAGSIFLFFAESVLDRSKKVEYHVASMQHGSTLILSKAALELAQSAVRFITGLSWSKGTTQCVPFPQDLSLKHWFCSVSQ